MHKFSIRYKIDIGIVEDYVSGQKNTKIKSPVGKTTEYVGTIEEIKKRLGKEVDKTCAQLEDIYFDRIEED